MMAISVCVNDAVLLLYMLLFKSCFGSSCDSHHLLLLVVISVLQRYKTDFSTSIGWYINIISVNEITVFNCKFKLKPKMLLPYFLQQNSGQFFTVNFTDFFLQCTVKSVRTHPL